MPNRIRHVDIVDYAFLMTMALKGEMGSTCPKEEICSDKLSNLVNWALHWTLNFECGFQNDSAYVTRSNKVNSQADKLPPMYVQQYVHCLGNRQDDLELHELRMNNWNSGTVFMTIRTLWKTTSYFEKRRGGVALLLRVWYILGYAW